MVHEVPQRAGIREVDPAPRSQSPSSWASQSRATVSVQDWSEAPSGSPVNGSKYSAKPLLTSRFRPTRFIPSARLSSPARTRDHHRIQSATGHSGPRQLLRGWKPHSSGLVLGANGQYSSSLPRKWGSRASSAGLRPFRDPRGRLPGTRNRLWYVPTRAPLPARRSPERARARAPSTLRAQAGRVRSRNRSLPAPPPRLRVLGRSRATPRWRRRGSR